MHVKRWYLFLVDFLRTFSESKINARRIIQLLDD